MTRNEIEKLQATRETDALIAQMLFGWTDAGIHSIIGPVRWFRRNDGSCVSEKQLPNYSTNIVYAWDVFEKLVEIEKFPTLHCGPTEYTDWPIYSVKLVNPSTDEVFATTAPLAICRAALLAVMEN